MPDAMSESGYRGTLDSLLEGFQIIGRDWTYLYVNPAAALHGQRTVAGLQGRTMQAAYPGIEETPLFAELQRCMAERVALSLENRFTFPDGRARWFELRIEPVPEGVCVHSVDIQSRKEAQLALERLNAELEERVAARTRDLENLNSELDSFSYSVSHDLRAPLRHANGYASALVEDAGPRLQEEDRHYLGRIVNATERMSKMIEALLSLSRLGRSPLKVQAVDLSEVVAGARADVGPDAEGREVEWVMDALPKAHADPTLLRLALVNLFSNALKFTRGRSPARVTVAAAPSEDGRELVLSVRDNGVGFDVSAARKLFGVFERLHNEKEFEGTGIGLANVRRIIARHGGRTWAEAKPGEGATFYLSLPQPV